MSGSDMSAGPFCPQIRSFQTVNLVGFLIILTSLPVVKEYECAGNRSELALLQSLLSYESGHCQRDSYGSYTLYGSASSDDNHGVDQCGRCRANKPQLPISGRISELFSNDVMEHYLVQTEVCNQTTEPLIFIFQLS